MKQFVCVIVLLATAFAQTAPIPVKSLPEKERVLWQKLEASIQDVDVHLDGVMGVAIEDITTFIPCSPRTWFRTAISWAASLRASRELRSAISPP